MSSSLTKALCWFTTFLGADRPSGRHTAVVQKGLFMTERVPKLATRGTCGTARPRLERARPRRTPGLPTTSYKTGRPAA